MSYLSSIFSYRVLALLLWLDDLFPLPLLHCADLLSLQLSLGAVIVCLLVLRGYGMRCFAVVDRFSIPLLTDIGCAESQTLFVSILVHMKQNIHINTAHQILRYTKYIELIQYYSWLPLFGKSSASVTTFSLREWVFHLGF